MLSYDASNPCRVEYFEVSTYTKDDMRKALLESCQYSFANRLAYNTFLGISEKTTLAMNYLEEAGRPPVDDSQLSPSGERSRNE